MPMATSKFRKAIAGLSDTNKCKKSYLTPKFMFCCGLGHFEGSQRNQIYMKLSHNKYSDGTWVSQKVGESNAKAGGFEGVRTRKYGYHFSPKFKGELRIFQGFCLRGKSLFKMLGEKEF